MEKKDAQKAKPKSASPNLVRPSLREGPVMFECLRKFSNYPRWTRNVVPIVEENIWISIIQKIKQLDGDPQYKKQYFQPACLEDRSSRSNSNFFCHLKNNAKNKLNFSFVF